MQPLISVGYPVQIIGEIFWDCICVDKHLPRFEELAYVVPHFDALTRVVGEQGWRSGESSRLPTMWPGFKSRRRRHMWVEFVVGSLPCSERFFSGYSGFPLSSKTNIFKFQFDQESGRRRTTMWMCYPQIVIYLFILVVPFFVKLCSYFSWSLAALATIFLTGIYFVTLVHRRNIGDNRISV